MCEEPMTGFKPCPFCNSEMELNGVILLCKKGHEFHPNIDDLVDPVRIRETWNAQPCFNMSFEERKRIMVDFFANISGWDSYDEYCKRGYKLMTGRNEGE